MRSGRLKPQKLAWSRARGPPIHLLLKRISNVLDAHWSEDANCLTGTPEISRYHVHIKSHARQSMVFISALLPSNETSRSPPSAPSNDKGGTPVDTHSTSAA